MKIFAAALAAFFILTLSLPAQTAPVKQSPSTKPAKQAHKYTWKTYTAAPGKWLLFDADTILGVYYVAERTYRPYDAAKKKWAEVCDDCLPDGVTVPGTASVTSPPPLCPNCPAGGTCPAPTLLPRLRR